MTSTTRAAMSHVASPLDPFLLTFLRELGSLADGYSPTVDGQGIADRCDVPPGFVEALFTSARTRGFVEAFRSSSAKKGYRWRVSNRGRQWAANGHAVADQASDG